MNITENNIVGELVAEDYHTASVFKSFGIDFCCKGNRTIAEVCQNKEIDAGKLIDQLKKVMQPSESSSPDYKHWPLDLLADYIEKKHHRYVQNKCREINPFLEKLVKVHGQSHPELFEIADQFFQAAIELTSHMQKEEMILFPYIRTMEERKAEDGIMPRPPFGTVENPITMMQQEHDIEGERFRKISKLSNQYTPPADACTTYKVTFALLKEFEEDLHLHIHLENNILFPGAIMMENELANAPTH